MSDEWQPTSPRQWLPAGFGSGAQAISAGLALPLFSAGAPAPSSMSKAADLAPLSRSISGKISGTPMLWPTSHSGGLPQHQQRSRQAGSEIHLRMRPTRTVLKELVATLDAVLPDAHRSTPRPNGAGSRSLGIAGRSMHDVLADVVRAVAACRADYDRKQMFRARGALVFEVEMPGWTIASMSPGAELFFRDAPWGIMEGQSLADLVQWEDLEDFNALFFNSGSTPRQIRLMHFHGAEDPQEVNGVLQSVKRRRMEPSSIHGNHVSTASAQGCARDSKPPKQKTAETEKYGHWQSLSSEPFPFPTHPSASSSTSSGGTASTTGINRLAPSSNRLLRTPSCTSTSFQRTLSAHCVGSAVLECSAFKFDPLLEGSEPPTDSNELKKGEYVGLYIQIVPLPSLPSGDVEGCGERGREQADSESILSSDADNSVTVGGGGGRDFLADPELDMTPDGVMSRSHTATTDTTHAETHPHIPAQQAKSRVLVVATLPV